MEIQLAIKHLKANGIAQFDHNNKSRLQIGDKSFSSGT